MTIEDPGTPALSTTDLAMAARNEPRDQFTLTNGHTGLTRTFDIKDLDYDSYIEFCDLARPIITAVAGAIEMKPNETGEMKLQFAPAGIAFDELIKLAGKELPRMAWLCCKQSAPNISLADVKALARRPHVMLEVVLKQIKVNEIVKEFADFFPRVAAALEDLMPAAQAAMLPTTTTESTV